MERLSVYIVYIYNLLVFVSVLMVLHSLYYFEFVGNMHVIDKSLKILMPFTVSRVMQ